jgi:hypothetical protein
MANAKWATVAPVEPDTAFRHEARPALIAAVFIVM